MLARQLYTTRLFGPLRMEQLTRLLEGACVRTAQAGEVIVEAARPMENHLILLDGEVEIQHAWSVRDDERDSEYTWKLGSYDAEADFGFLSASARGRCVSALTDIRYLFVDADRLDRIAGWTQQFCDLIARNPALQQRINLVMQTSIFNRLAVDHAEEALHRLSVRSVRAGETIIRQGDAGDAYFIVEEGEAELVRIDPFTDEVQRRLLLGAGDAVGEEALLQDGYRNASLTMLTPGKLLVLSKSDFDELVKPGVKYDISPDEAYRLIKSGARQLIDCRYSMEFEDSRIPGARLISLDQIRFQVSSLDPDRAYVVYCRSGRRSRTAAFLLRERNINAVSLEGGIRDWPYEIDSRPVTDDARLNQDR